MSQKSVDKITVIHFPTSVFGLRSDLLPYSKYGI